MSIGQKISASFDLSSEKFRKKYENNPIKFLEEKCGRKYPRKIRKAFEDIYFGRIYYAVMQANRGGGKSTFFADLSACLYAFKDFDGLMVGGSEAQSKNDYKYASQVLQIDEDLDDLHSEVLKTICVSQKGNWLKFVPASTKQTRGPHCGDPHKQMKNEMQAHGGILIIDEECEADEDIISSVIYVVNTAEPGIILRGSTLHKVDGTFAALCEDPNAQGYTKYQWDCFDTASGCERDCKKCRFEFAGNKRRGFDKWKKNHLEWKHKNGYCEGRAKQSDGFRSIESIEQSFQRAKNLSEFEVEEMGWRAGGDGLILDPVLMDECLRGETIYIDGNPTCITIDWGYSGWTCIHVLQEQQDQEIAVLQTEYFHQMLDDLIYMRIDALRKIYNTNLIYADSSHKFQNQNLIFRGYKLIEVEFAKWKEYGAGWIKGLVERKKLKISGIRKNRGELRKRDDKKNRGEMRKGDDKKNRGQTRDPRGVSQCLTPKSEISKAENFFWDTQSERLHSELKGWRRNKQGKIVKKDDHGPDSLLCASLFFGEGKIAEFEFKSSGRRESKELMDLYIDRRRINRSSRCLTQTKRY